MFWALPLLTLACDKPLSGGDDTGCEAPCGDGGDDGGDDRGVEPGLTPAWFTVSGQACLDVEGGSLQDCVDSNGDDIPTDVRIHFTDDEGSQLCIVTMRLGDASAVPLEDWSWTDAMPETGPEEMHHTGLKVPEDVSVIEEGCEDFDFGALGSATEAVGSWTWGIGFGSLRTVVIAAVEEGAGGDAGTYLERDQLFGGSWSSNIFDPTTWASHFAVGCPASAGTVATTSSGDCESHHSTTEAPDDEPVPTGLWLLSPAWSWSVATWMGEA